MTHGSLFSGGGGFDLAAQWAGWTNLFNCEINPFCRTILKYHFPDAEQYSDIRTTDFSIWRGRIDVLSGGFPCQPFSQAGKRKGTDDDRYLWPEMLRAIREVRPRWVVGENVLGIVNWSKGLVFEQVCADLEAEGYEVQPYILPACGKWQDFPTQSPVRSRDDGISGITHIKAVSKEDTMDRTELILKCLNEGRIETDPATGKIYSRMIRGYEGQRVELVGSDCNGYRVHSIKYNGIKKQVRAHQVIWISVNGPYDKDKLMIDHINRDRTDNRIVNLRLVTAQGNRANQEPRKGKLSQAEIDMMYFLHTEDGISIRELAEDYGISKSRVQQLIQAHSGLDGITFPKWRQESIKLYGNAIVPQVALQIFETINEITRREA